MHKAEKLIKMKDDDKPIIASLIEKQRENAENIEYETTIKIKSEIEKRHELSGTYSKLKN